MIDPRRAISWSLLLFCAAAPVSIAGLNIAAAALTAALLWAGLSKSNVPWNAARNPLVYALGAYVAAAIVCSALGVDPKTSFGTLYKDAHKLWLLALLLVALSWERPRGVPAALGLGLLATSLAGIRQTLFTHTAGEPTLVRAHGFVHPVTYGELIALLWLGGLCLRLAPVSREKNDRRVLHAILAVSGLAFVFNETRGAFLGLAAGILTLAAAQPKLRKIALSLALWAPILLVVWELLPTTHNFSNLYIRMHDLGAANPFLARLTLWRVGLQMFRDHPLFGVGPGNYLTVFTRYFQGELDRQRVWGSAHDLYIHQAAERGLAGLAALAGVLGTMTAMAAAKARRRPDAANLWALAACAAFLAMNLTEVAFQNEQVTSLLLFIWAYAETR